MEALNYSVGTIPTILKLLIGVQLRRVVEHTAISLYKHLDFLCVEIKECEDSMQLHLDPECAGWR